MAVSTGIVTKDAEPTFVGRTQEVRQFQAALEQVLNGSSQLFMLLGEPGIGKTRCAEAFADIAEEQGVLVLWGRCYEEPGAPPYWPWIQLLRGYIEASSASEVQLALDDGGADLVRLLPELTGQLRGALPARDNDDPGQARFRTFDSIAQLLARAARQVPLTLVIDNLHWADAPSLSLLEFICQELSGSRVLVLVTYRDGEVSRHSPLLRTLGGLAREPRVERLRLGGIDVEAIDRLSNRILDQHVPQQVVTEIYKRTDGNPLFVIELLKVLIDEGRDAGLEPVAVRIPDGVRETIGRRVSRLPHDCNDLLTAASVLGRDFGADEVAAVTDRAMKDVLVSLDAAERAGIIGFTATPAQFSFAHALIRETLYGELGTLERLQLHGRCGDALVQLRGSALQPVLSRIAHHYFESAALGHVDKAVDFAFRAAKAAVTMYAFEDAATHYQHVIDLLESNGMADDRQVARACSLQAYAFECVGDVTQATASLVKAASATHRLGDVETLAGIAWELTLMTSCARQDEHLPLLRKLLDLLPEKDSATRATTLASLATVSRGSGLHDEVRSLVEEAIGMAERVGDNAALCAVCSLSMLALRGRPDTLSLRLELGSRLLQTARQHDKAYPKGDATTFQWLNLMDAGRIDESVQLLTSYESPTVSHLRLHQLFLRAGQVAIDLLRGEWAGLEQRIEAVRDAGMKIRGGDAEGVYSSQMFTLNRDLGRLNGLAPAVRGIVASGARTWAPGLMLLCAEIGMLDESRAQFEILASDNYASLAEDDMYATCLVYCAETCARLGDAGRATPLYERLLPYAEQTINHPRAVCFGSSQLYLGMLAATDGRRELATQHFQAALERNGDMRAWPWLARTQYHYGILLLREQDDEQREAGRRALREAEQLAERLQMAALLVDIDFELRGGDEPLSYPDDLTAREMEVLQLMSLGRSNRDISLVLSISLNTVATHVRNILNKTHSANRTEAAAYALRKGLATLE